MRRSVLLVAPLAAIALFAAACGSSGSGGTGSGASPSSANLKDPGKRTIGVIPSTATSENLGVWIAQLKAAAEPLGWTVDVCDPAGDVTKMEGCAQSFVTKKVDAIVTMALGGEEIPNGFKQAAAANIPVMAFGTTVTPGNEKLYTGGIYADDIVASGAATGEWIKANRPDIPIVGQEITANYGGQGYINGLVDQLKTDGLKFADLRDTNLADLVNSMTKTAEAQVQANAGQFTMIDFSDFGASLWEPVFKRANRSADITTITRYDNPSTVKQMQGGAQILVSVTKQWQHQFDMLNAMLAHFNDGTAFPPNSETVNNPGATVAGIKDFPAGATRFYPFQPELDKQVAEWAKTYNLQPSTLTAP